MSKRSILVTDIKGTGGIYRLRVQECPRCEGGGLVMEDKAVECRFCLGNGKRWTAEPVTVAMALLAAVSRA